MSESVLAEGIAQFNRGEYFESHETLETLWLAERGPHREFYQGLIQVAAGLLHRSRDNRGGAVALLQRGVTHLAPFAPDCLGVNVMDLIQAVDEALKRLDAELPSERDGPPYFQVRPSRSPSQNPLDAPQ